jgi:L-aminopeptidase/D-esterase-like protein
VPGVQVGHATIIQGEGPLKVGKGPVRTGVTAILPRGKTFDLVFAARYVLNGNGDGSVRFIKEQVGFRIFQALTTRAGGEVVSADAF